MFKLTSTTTGQLQRLSTYHRIRNSICQISTVQSSKNLNSNNAMKSRINQSSLTNVTIVPKRNIHPLSAIGLDRAKLRDTHQKFMDKNGSHKARFLERLSACLESSNFDSFLLSDYIHLIDMVENDEEMDLLDKITAYLHASNRYKFHRWGNWLIRRYYRLNQIDRAHKNIMNIERFGDIFTRLPCLKLSLSWLYSEGRYQEVVDEFNLALKCLSGVESENESMVNLAAVAFAALAKINTPEALKQAEEIMKSEFFHAGISYYLKSRVVTFVAYLAYQQGQYHSALNYLHNPGPNMRYLSMRELRAKSWLKLGLYEDLLATITSDDDIRSGKFSLDFCNMVEQAYPDIVDDEIRQTLKDAIERIKKENKSLDVDLDELIFKDIIIRDNDFPKENDRRFPYQARHNNMYRPDRNYDGSKKSFDRFEGRTENRFDRREQRYGEPRDRQRGKSYIDDDLDTPDFPDDELSGGSYERNFR